MSDEGASFYRLGGHFNNYGWGKKGRNSEVANLFAAGHPYSIEEEKPYSELWMGTHPDGPATIRDMNMKLSEFIARTESEGNFKTQESNNNLRKRVEVHLPFIMKVMSIAKTLSLQVHPTKHMAEQLHKRDPVNYPDRNHKPELAYALTRFELLCGFRPAMEMQNNLNAFSCLQDLFGQEESQNLLRLLKRVRRNEDPTDLKYRIALAACFQNMMTADKYTVKRLLHQLMEELDRGVRGALMEETISVIRKMAVDFPGDVGVFSPLFLNHMILEPGECCYYAAEELHAYLSGECVECVGCSNNTIRAALTPKFIDRPNLCDALNYRMTSQEDYLVPPQPLRDFPCVDEYAPDCKDFQLHRIRVPHGRGAFSLPPLDCGSIMIVHSGRAFLEDEPGASGTNKMHSSGDLESKRSSEVKRGDIFYIRPGKRLRINWCSENLEAFRTFSFEQGPDHENRTVVGKRHLNGIGYDQNGSRTENIEIERPRFHLESRMDLEDLDDLEMDGFLI